MTSQPKLDDDLRLRYLQAQRKVREPVDEDLLQSFSPEDVEKELHIYERLRDDEAFEDWLSMGITTTVESTLADADSREREEREKREAEALARREEETDTSQTDPWAEFRLLMVRKIRGGTAPVKKALASSAASIEASGSQSLPLKPVDSFVAPNKELLYVDSKAAEEFAVTVMVAEQTIAALEAKLETLIQQQAGCSLAQLRAKFADLITDIERIRSFDAAAAGHALRTPPTPALATPTTPAAEAAAAAAAWAAFAPDSLFITADLIHRLQTLLTVTEDASETFVAATIDLDTVRTRLMDAQAPDEDAAMTREVLAARAVDLEQQLHELGDMSLNLTYLRQSCDRFASESGPALRRIQQGVTDLQQTLHHIADLDYRKRRDALDEQAEEISLASTVVVGHVDQLINLPFDIPAHRSWQNRLAEYALMQVQGCSAMYLSLFASEPQIESSGERGAARIKAWVEEGLSLPEIAFRSSRQESLRLGLALCTHARHTLKETGRKFDRFWGFTYW